MRSPDRAHRPTATYAVSVPQTQIWKGQQYARSVRHHPYNLFTFNCTTFAREFFERATGEDAPSGGMVFEDPSDLAASIAEKNGRDRERGR